MIPQHSDLCLLPYLVQGGLQQLLPLLGLQQEALPALVQMVQLVPQLAGLVARRRLQQLSASTVHILHSGMMGKNIIT